MKSHDVLIEQILQQHRRYGESALTGEWDEIQKESRRSYIAALRAYDNAELRTQLNGMFSSSVTHGLVSFSIQEFHKDFAKASDDYVRGVRACMHQWAMYGSGSTDHSRLGFPEVGSPLCVGVTNGELVIPVMLDTPRHDHYASTILGFREPIFDVFEIGGGYGGMALQLLRQDPSVCITLCDMPETLYLAWYFLNAAGMTVEWYDNPEPSQVRLLPMYDIDKYDQNVDVVFAAHCLSEMSPETTKQYLALVHRLSPKYFYHDSAHRPPGLLRELLSKGHEVLSAEQWPEVQACDLIPGPPYHELYRAPTLWPGTAQRYWEFVYEKR